MKEMHDQLVTVQTLEYHNRNCTWRELLLEVKKDYKNAIISQVCVCVCVVCVHFVCVRVSLLQTIKSAIGIRESEERAGLASPKLVRFATMSPCMHPQTHAQAHAHTYAHGISHKEFSRHTSDILMGGIKVKYIYCTLLDLQ